MREITVNLYDSDWEKLVDLARKDGFYKILPIMQENHRR